MMGVPGSLKGQKMASVFLELGLETIVNICVCWELNLGLLQEQ